jgi:shikimate kinase
MNPARNLFLIGPTGAGKTSVGRRLATHYGLDFLDLDQEIERHCGVPVATIFELEGEPGFRRRECAQLDVCTQRTHVLLATGAGAVLDASNRKHLAERGFVLWLDVGIDRQLERLAHDRHRPLLAGEDRRRRLEAMSAQRTPLYREIADLAVTGDDAGVAATVGRCIALLDLHWQRTSVAA